MLLYLVDLWARWGLNPRPRDYESPALTTELQALIRVLCTTQYSSVGALCRLQGVPLYAVFAMHFFRF